MKIYYHPASTTSRPVMLFAAENGIDADFQLVDLFTGEHFKQPFEAINPNHLVPVLEDGGFRLTESSAILKYLADKIQSPAYPKDLRQRARVNERMDPNVKRWLGNMKRLKNWNKVNEAIDGFAASLKDVKLEAL